MFQTKRDELIASWKKRYYFRCKRNKYIEKSYFELFIFIKSLYDITPVNVSFKFRCIVAIFVLTHHQDMEDAHTQLLSLPGDKDAMFFGVFDGHGGT